MKANAIKWACLPFICAALCCCNGNNTNNNEEEFVFPEELEDAAFVAPARGAAAEAVEAAEDAIDATDSTLAALADEAIDSIDEIEDEALEAVEDVLDVASTEETVLELAQVDTKPSFNGGNANDFLRWVNSHLSYPESALDNNESGKVVLGFTVGSNGKVSNVRVLKGVSESLDAEAIRVVKKSPAWAPALKDGEPVAVNYVFPVNFQIQ